MADPPPVRGWLPHEYCHSCRVYDKHPRHTHVGNDGSITHKHMDCCALDGCPNGSCADIVRSSAGRQGDQLKAWLHSAGLTETVMAAAARGARWAHTAKATGKFTPPRWER